MFRIHRSPFEPIKLLPVPMVTDHQTDRERKTSVDCGPF